MRLHPVVLRAWLDGKWPNLPKNRDAVVRNHVNVSCVVSDWFETCKSTTDPGGPDSNLALVSLVGVTAASLATADYQAAMQLYKDHI